MTLAIGIGTTTDEPKQETRQSKQETDNTRHKLGDGDFKAVTVAEATSFVRETRSAILRSTQAV